MILNDAPSSPHEQPGKKNVAILGKELQVSSETFPFPMYVFLLLLYCREIQPIMEQALAIYCRGGILSCLKLNVASVSL